MTGAISDHLEQGNLTVFLTIRCAELSKAVVDALGELKQTRQVDPHVVAAYQALVKVRGDGHR